MHVAHTFTPAAKTAPTAPVPTGAPPAAGPMGAGGLADDILGTLSGPLAGDGEAQGQGAIGLPGAAPADAAAAPAAGPDLSPARLAWLAKAAAAGKTAKDGQPAQASFADTLAAALAPPTAQTAPAPAQASLPASATASIPASADDDDKDDAAAGSAAPADPQTTPLAFLASLAIQAQSQPAAGGSQPVQPEAPAPGAAPAAAFVPAQPGPAQTAIFAQAAPQSPAPADQQAAGQDDASDAPLIMAAAQPETRPSGAPVIGDQAPATKTRPAMAATPEASPSLPPQAAAAPAPAIPPVQAAAAQAQTIPPAQAAAAPAQVAAQPGPTASAAAPSQPQVPAQSQPQAPAAPLQTVQTVQAAQAEQAAAPSQAQPAPLSGTSPAKTVGKAASASAIASTGPSKTAATMAAANVRPVKDDAPAIEGALPSFAGADIQPAPQDGAAPASAMPPAAAQVAAQPQTPRAGPETVQRLAVQIVQTAQGAASQFHLTLHPAELGGVQVKIQVGRDGVVSASMTFDNAGAAADLGAQADDLKAALAQAGFDVGDNGLSFNLSGGNRQAQDNGPDSGAWGGRAFRAAAAGADDLLTAVNEAASRLQGASSASGLDIRI